MEKEKEIEEEVKPQTNLVDKTETTRIIIETLDLLSKAVGGSLGPFGYNTIIQDKYGQHDITKDGFTILRNLYLYEKGNRGIFDNLINISKALVQNVGDGSSSAIIIAKRFFELLSEFKGAYKVNANVIKGYLNEIEALITEEVEKTSVKLIESNADSLKAVERIANVSTNGDEEATKLVLDLYTAIDLKGQPDLEISKTEHSTIEIIDGFQYEGGYYHDIMINDTDTNSVVFENPLIFMSNGMLTQNDIGMLAKMLHVYVAEPMGRQESPQPMVILAPKADKTIYDFFTMNLKENRGLPIVLAEIPVGTQFGRERFNDLAAFLGVEPYDKMEGESLKLFPDQRLGRAEKIKISKDTTTIIKPIRKDDTLLEVRLTNIREKIAEYGNASGSIDYTAAIGKLKKREISITGKLGTIFIGGESEAEKRTRRFLIEDAILAVKSAITHGYVYGGNLLIPFTIQNKLDEFLEKIKPDYTEEAYGRMKELFLIVSRSFQYSYIRVLDNFYNDNPNEDTVDKKSTEILEECLKNNSIYNLKTMEYERLHQTSVINSLKTDVQIMKSVFSIITLLVTSNQMLRDI